MSILSQIAIALMVILTVAILIYANKRLSDAEKEGEHFVDEWAMRQIKKEEKKNKMLEMEHPEQEEYDEEDVFNEAEEMTFASEEEEEYEEGSEDNIFKDNVIPMRKKITPGIELKMLDERQNVIDTILVDQIPFMIGRGKENHLVLNDLSVAMRHGKIVEKNGTILLQDMGTANKIYANGQIVSECILKDKIHFYIGGYEFVVSEKTHRSTPTLLANGSERISL